MSVWKKSGRGLWLPGQDSESLVKTASPVSSHIAGEPPDAEMSDGSGCVEGQARLTFNP